MSTFKECGHHPDLICGCGVMPEPTPNPQHVAEFERLFGESQGKRRSMSENTNERLDRYAAAIHEGALGCERPHESIAATTVVHRIPARVVMAVSDAEQADLRAEVNEWARRWHDMKAERDAAEAERDRARSLAATLEARLVEVEATLWDHPDCIGECACAKNAVDAVLNPKGDA